MEWSRKILRSVEVDQKYKEWLCLYFLNVFQAANCIRFIACIFLQNIEAEQ